MPLHCAYILKISLPLLGNLPYGKTPIELSKMRPQILYAT